MKGGCDFEFSRQADFFSVSFSLTFWLTTEKHSTINLKISPIISGLITSYQVVPKCMYVCVVCVCILQSQPFKHPQCTAATVMIH